MAINIFGSLKKEEEEEETRNKIFYNYKVVLYVRITRGRGAKKHFYNTQTYFTKFHKSFSILSSGEEGGRLDPVFLDENT